MYYTHDSIQSQTRLVQRLSDVTFSDLAHFVVFAALARCTAHHSLKLASRLLDMFPGVHISQSFCMRRSTSQFALVAP